MTTPESLNAIVTFVVAAQSASFAEAGKHLAMSRSGVAVAISRLEARLGVRLFHRSKHHLSLTADGEGYYSACSAALAKIRNAEDKLRARLIDLG
jgi:DNA-binding transcriptional LysR family regulator